MAQFARNLSSNVLENDAVAVMVNQCLHCHDANGATNAAAQVTGGSATKPFASTITGGNYIAGYDVSAGNIAGGVINVDTSFNVANAAYHPVKGKQNNSYVSSARMYAPWNGITKTGGNLTSWGYLITCWDCHAPVGATGPQAMTVTAHGGAATLRQNPYSGTATNLCTVCHNVTAGSGSHGAGSAWNTGTRNEPGAIAKTSCYRCHGHTYAVPTRPYRAQDAHGVDGFAPNMGTDRAWPIGATDTYKPYAFFRNAGSAGQWATTGVNWKPLSGPNVPAGSATCGSGTLNSACGNENHGPYGPGGMY
jgi:hypothetical protein